LLIFQKVYISNKTSAIAVPASLPANHVFKIAGTVLIFLYTKTKGLPVNKTKTTGFPVLIIHNSSFGLVEFQCSSTATFSLISADSPSAAIITSDRPAISKLQQVVL
jgi:hypothetical protein